MPEFHLAPSVYATTLGQDVILLDLAQRNKEQQYAVIKGGAPFFLALLTDASFPGSSQEFNTNVATCFQKGWLCNEPAEIPQPALLSHWPRPGWLPLRIEALLCLQQVEQAIERNAFLPYVRFLMMLPTQQRNEHDPRIPRILQAVGEAACMTKRRKTCLHQSMAMCRMLRVRGISAQVAIRFQQDPLLGHMILIDGENVLSWQPGLTSITILEHFLGRTTLLFHSGELDTHFYQYQGGK